MMNLTLTITGPVRTGKSTLAALIQGLLDDHGIESRIHDLDQLHFENRKALMELAHDVLAGKVKIEILVAQTNRTAKV